ncbi:MAG: carbohydrate ABC transporter permease [Thermomicrobiales bacterium]
MTSGEMTAGQIGTMSQDAADVWHPKRRIKWGTIGRHAFLIVLCLWVLLPLAWVLLLSVKSLPDGTQRYLWPENFADPIFTHYRFVIEKGQAAVISFKNSVLVTALTVVASTVTAVLAGYALVHLKTPFRAVVTALLVASLFFPTRVTALLGIYNIQASLGLINVTWSLMLPYTALTVAISVFIMRGVFETVPKELVDSARIDGANSFRILGGIMLPLVRNGIVVVIIVNFVAAWGEFLLALTLMNDAAKRTLPVFIATSSGGVGALLWPRVAALYIIAILPALITFAIAQRWFMKGLQEGALKA